MTTYAVNLQRPTDARKPQKGKRAEASSWDPINERAKLVADRLFERAKNLDRAQKMLSAILAPDVPSDTEEVEPFMQWQVLETVALNLTPHFWDNPDAIEDLYKLRQQFAPALATPDLPAVARLRRTEKRLLPDPSVTPASPEWEQKQRRLKA